LYGVCAHVSKTGLRNRIPAVTLLAKAAK
jgi:hypothetical protein